MRGAKHREKEATHSAMNHRAQNPVIMYVWCIAVPLSVWSVRWCVKPYGFTRETDTAARLI